MVVLSNTWTAAASIAAAGSTASTLPTVNRIAAATATVAGCNNRYKIQHQGRVSLGSQQKQHSKSKSDSSNNRSKGSNNCH